MNTESKEWVSTKVELMVFEMKKFERSRFAPLSLRSKTWNWKPAFDKAFNDLKREASLQFKAIQKGFQ